MNLYPLHFDFVFPESEFSKFVASTYNRPFSLQQLLMLPRRSFQTFDIAGTVESWSYAEDQLRDWLAQWEELKVDLARDEFFKSTYAEREHRIDLDVIAWGLYRRGLLKPGRYLLLVDW